MDPRHASAYRTVYIRDSSVSPGAARTIATADHQKLILTAIRSVARLCASGRLV